MKSNPKKLSLAKSKSVISQRQNKFIEIPKDAPKSINLFTKEENKILRLEQKK